MALFSALVLAFHLAVMPALPVAGSATVSRFIELLDSLMTWMMKAAPHALEIATAWYVAVFNIGNALTERSTSAISR